MQERNYLKTQLIKLGLQFFLYISIFLCFFTCMSISHIGLRTICRTSVIVILTFFVLMVLFTAVYGGFAVGIKKKRSVFASVLLTSFFTDLISYVTLQIMNVNPNNPEADASLQLIGEDLALLFGAFILQFACIYFFVTIGFNIYWKLNPPKCCTIIASTQEAADHVAQKIGSFPQRFCLKEIVSYRIPDLEQTIMNCDVIFLAAVPDTEEAEIERLCYRCHRNIYLMAELEDVITSTSRREVLDDTAFLDLRCSEMTLWQRFIKRFFDILISAVALIVLSPLLLGTVILLKIKGNGSPIFKQARATRDGKVFNIYKFRTMYEDVQNFSALSDDERITPVGKFLRRYRIDELPQFFNVLKGDMSLVGPRPEMLENVEKYTKDVPEFRYRQKMKAGLTGLAQIEGKYNTTPQDKAMLDLMYIEGFSIGMDFTLLLRTFTVFLRRDSTEGFGEKHVQTPQMRLGASTN